MIDGSEEKKKTQYLIAKADEDAETEGEERGEIAATKRTPSRKHERCAGNFRLVCPERREGVRYGAASWLGLGVGGWVATAVGTVSVGTSVLRWSHHR